MMDNVLGRIASTTCSEKHLPFLYLFNCSQGNNFFFCGNDTVALDSHYPSVATKHKLVCVNTADKRYIFCASA